MSGFRLFRRKKLAPGLRLNLSRSGPSLRIGPRGAGITVGGRRGLRTTVGVPGTGIYYTKTAGGHRRVRRSAAPLRSSYAGPVTTTSYKGCLYVIGAIVLLALAVVTYGLILIPVAIGIGVWIWYRRRQPDSIAGRIIKQALAAPPPAAVHLLNQAIEADPHGPNTLRACGSWFYDHQCWQDAAEAYAGLLHTQSDWDSERRYVTCLLAANRPDEAIPRLENLRSISPADDYVQAALLGQLATAYLLKGDVGQAAAFIDLAPLQKRNLDTALQGCLYLRAAVRYLSGDRRRAIADLERLYAVNPAMPGVGDSKAAMQAGTFKFSKPQPNPDWYPPDQVDSDLTSEPAERQELPPPVSGSGDNVLPPAAQSPPSADVQPMPAFQIEPPATNVAASQASEPVQQAAEATTANPAVLVSADGAWRWDGARWLPNSQLQAANVPPDWLQLALWRSWDSPLNLIRGESRHQDVFLRRWSINPTTQHWVPVAVALIREPKNPVDTNAIRAELDGEQIGYLAREVAEVFSPQLDRAGRVQFTVAGVVCGGSADAPSFGLHVWLDMRLSEGPAWEDAGH